MFTYALQIAHPITPQPLVNGPAYEATDTVFHETSFTETKDIVANFRRKQPEFDGKPVLAIFNVSTQRFLFLFQHAC